ncbi:hypothetical protein DXG01_000768 [Tephrocybe rancida]|nr:hypothetical protein DXG01_000768 [Tephrocybe rancida]
MTLPMPEITTLQSQFASFNPFKLHAEQEAARANYLQQQHAEEHRRDQKSPFPHCTLYRPSHSIDSMPYTTLHNQHISQYQPGISEADSDRPVQLYFPHRQQEGRSLHQQLRRREGRTIQHQIIQLEQQLGQRANLDETTHETWKEGLPLFSQQRQGLGRPDNSLFNRIVLMGSRRITLNLSHSDDKSTSTETQKLIYAPANALLDRSGRAYLADFGPSNIDDPQILHWISQSSGASRGSARWQAPELHESDNGFDAEAPIVIRNTEKSDVFAPCAFATK